MITIKDVKGMRIPKDRAPTPPGEMLLEKYLKPLRMTQVELAERIRVPYVRVNPEAPHGSEPPLEDDGRVGCGSRRRSRHRRVAGARKVLETVGRHR